MLADVRNARLPTCGTEIAGVHTAIAGFHSACEDLGPTRRFVVHGGNESFPLAKDIRAMSLPAMVALAVGSR